VNTDCTLDNVGLKGDTDGDGVGAGDATDGGGDSARYVAGGEAAL